MTTRIPAAALLTVLLMPATTAVAAPLDLAEVSVVVKQDGELQVPAQVLVEEIAARTGLTWRLMERPGDQGAILFQHVEATEDVGREGFKITTGDGRIPQLTISAAGRRGALYAVGYLLRHLDCGPNRAALSDPINTTQSPQYDIRGHQLGYRPKANSYDGWDEEQYDRYIRELTFFGTNCVENIPFHGEQPSPIMPLDREEMMRVMASICDKYDVDYWVWTPADFDLTDLKKRAEALRFHEDFYRTCPRLDAIFFPGGDPGDNHPREVMPYLEDLAKILPQYHPQARIWMSLQGFDKEKTDYFFAWLDEHNPTWLGGVVGGPGSPPLPELRARLDQRYPLRDYPDITHIVRCQHPELNLDPVFALTAGREPINPRPQFYAGVFAETAPHTNGFLSYSDGCQDDVNKALWSTLGWDPEQQPRQILTEYARCFFPGTDPEQIADGILALEQNWNGALRDNRGVPQTLAHWQEQEAKHPELAGNWRWQMLVLRAYYDAYQQERLARETALEQQVYQAIDQRDGRLPTDAIREAREILSQAVTNSVRPDWRNRIIELFDDLYETVRFQSSVEKYHAMHPQRGCMLDFLDYPLNNRFWLEDEFHKVLTLPNLETRRERLEQLRTWEQPGPGSFYDDIGHVARSPHVIRDPQRRGSFGSYWWVDNGMSRYRLSWLVTDSPYALEYDQLDRDASYVLRFSGFGELKPRADGRPLQPTLYETDMNTLKEFPVPAEHTHDGKLTVTFDSVYLPGVNWRRQPRVAEAWLIKVPKDAAVTSAAK